MMYGFGDMDEYNELAKEISSISARELMENECDPEMEKNLNSVVVPMLEADEFMPKKKEPSEEESNDVDAFFKAAGNTPDKKKEPEAQLGSSATVSEGGDGNDLDPIGKDPLEEGLGGGFSPDKKLGLHEAFDREDASDENPMKDAQKNANNIDKVKDTFRTALDMKFETPKTIKYDLDSTHAKNHVSETPIRKIPRGW